MVIELRKRGTEVSVDILKGPGRAQSVDVVWVNPRCKKMYGESSKPNLAQTMSFSRDSL